MTDIIHQELSPGSVAYSLEKLSGYWGGRLHNPVAKVAPTDREAGPIIVASPIIADTCFFVATVPAITFSFLSSCSLFLEKSARVPYRASNLNALIKSINR